MDFKERIDVLMKENLTEKSYKFYESLKLIIPSVWDRYTSSSFKYHQKEDGRVPSIAEHTYEMLYACSKVIKLFEFEQKSKNSDVLFLSIFLHDSFKYGIKNPLERKHTDSTHDQIIGNTILSNRKKFLEILNEDQINKLEHITRYHSGKWSTDFGRNDSLKNLSVETLFVHFLDMLSANNCLKIPNIKE
jgi:hypothetical protein